jgi:predicted HTH transcriptional regulator
MLKKENKETGTLIVYTDMERKLFNYLEEQGKITLKQFSKITRSSHKNAQKVLVNLILTGLIEPHTSEKEEYFTFINSK